MKLSSIFTNEIHIKTNKTSEEIYNIINTVTGKSTLSGKEFTGTVTTENFNLYPACHFIGNLRIKIYGKITKLSNGSEIHIKAEIAAQSLILTLLIMFAILLIQQLFEGIISATTNGFNDYNLLQIGVPAVFTIAFLVLYKLFIKIPMNKALDRLNELLTN